MNYFFKHARDPISSFSHFIGAILSVVGLVLMAIKLGSAPVFSLSNTLSGIIFCISLIALYSSSAIYHFVKVSPEALKRLRKLDHAMIYVLIAGTYTPALLGCLPPDHAFWLTLTIWIIAAVGIIIKMFWMTAPRFLSTAMYIAMGWFILIDIKNLTMSLPAVMLLVSGGVAYTIGGVIYAIKKPNFSKDFGFHEFFHIFVVLGSLLHYLFVYCYVI